MEFDNIETVKRAVEFDCGVAIVPETTVQSGGIGGFLEIKPDHITILADAAERADEIDIARAEAAKKRAEDRLAGRATVAQADLVNAEAALRRALARLRVAEEDMRQKAGSKPSYLITLQLPRSFEPI